MRELTPADVRHVAEGAAVLASGGGGDPNIGILAACEAIRTYGPPRMLAFEEVDPDLQVAVPWLIGSPVPLVEKFPVGHELDDSWRGLERALGYSLGAILPAEIGGVNSLVPIVLASRIGLPLIDADCMGRAYPDISMLTLTLEGINATPLAVVDEGGNEVVIRTRNNRWAERLARAAAVQFGAVCSIASYPTRASSASSASIHGSVSRAEAVGRLLAAAKRDSRSPLPDLAKALNARELFSGKIIDIDRQTSQGWAVGECRIAGAGPYADQTVTVTFQNENLRAVNDGVVVASVPDIISVLDAESGAAITTENLRYGYRVTVVGIPCDQRWKTAAGLALGGPAAFGYDHTYVPL